MKESGWRPQTFLCSGLEDMGMDKCWEVIQKYNQKIKTNGFYQTQRDQQALSWFEESLKQSLLGMIAQDEKWKERYEDEKKAVKAHLRSPIEAAESIVKDWFAQHS